MELLSGDLSDICVLARECSKGTLDLPQIEGISLPALLGATTQSSHARAEGSSTLFDYLKGGKDLRIHQLLSLIDGGGNLPAKPSDQAESTEFYHLQTSGDILSDKWDLFCDRFKRRLQREYGARGFNDLIKAIHEIADNVFEHAGNLHMPGRASLAGFHFGNDHAVFSIADVGKGFLGSLRESTKWNHLATDKAAISAVVRNGATSRNGQDCGGGFTDLFSCLLEYNVTVLVRSGTCRSKIYQGSTDRILESCVGGPMVGAQVTVVVKRSKFYEEQKM